MRKSMPRTPQQTLDVSSSSLQTVHDIGFDRHSKSAADGIYIVNIKE